MTEGLKFGLAIGVAAVGSAVCMLVVGRRWPRAAGRGEQSGRRESPDSGNRTSVAAVAIGVLGGYAMLGLWPRWPPVNALDRLLVVVLPVTVSLLLVDRWPRKWRALRWGLGFGLAVAAARVLLHGSVYLQESAGRTGLLLLGSAGLLMVVFSLFERLWIRRHLQRDGVRRRRALLPLALAAALLVTGLLIAMAGYVNGGTAALPCGAAVAGATVGASLTGRDVNLRGLVALAVVALFGFLYIGRFFGGLTSGTALFVLLAPLLSWASELPPLRRFSPGVRDLVGLALVAVCLLGVLLGSKRTFDREMAPLVSQSCSRLDRGLPRAHYLFGQQNRRMRLPSGSRVFTSRSPSGSRAG